jgi:hypothetical protein
MPREFDTMIWYLIACGALAPRACATAEVARIEGRVRAKMAGHPEAENACKACGCELQLSQGETCYACQLQRLFPDFRLTRTTALGYRDTVVNPRISA